MNLSTDDLPENSDSLTVQYLPLIRRIVYQLHRKFGKKHDVDDMLSEAIIAALVAEKRYDPEKGKFGNFIQQAVTGAVIRSITSTSTKHQHTLNRIYTYIDEYIVEHKKIPSIDMTLEALHIPAVAYKRALRNSEELVKLSLTAMQDATDEVEDSMLEDIADAIEKLQPKLRTEVYRMLQGLSYNTGLYGKAVKQLREVLTTN